MRARIIGHAESEFSPAEKTQSQQETIYDTTKQALKAANLGIEDIDTVIQGGDDVLDGVNINHVYHVEPAGAFLKEESKIEMDGAYSLFYGLCRLGSGKYNIAMITAYSKSSESSTEYTTGEKPYSYPEVSGNWYYHSQLDPFFLRPLGHDVSSYHAMQYQAFLAESGLSEEDVARCVSKNKTQGTSNDNAPFASKTSVDDVMKSGYVASPLKKQELPPQTDGVSILIVATDEWATQNKRDGVSITGVGSAADAFYPGYRQLAGAPTANIAMQKALKMSGAKASAVQAAELYDLFSYQEPLLYKELFGWEYAAIKEKLASGFTSVGGDLPINASGGALCAHPILAAGLSRIIHLEKSMKANNYKCGIAHAQCGFGMQSNIVYTLEA